MFNQLTNNTMKKFNHPFASVLFLAVAALISHSCKDDEPVAPPVPGTDYSKGVFVINEGKFGDGTGSVTHFKRPDMEATYDLFQEKNNLPLGNIAQSMNQVGNTGFIVVNNANLIWIVTMKNFKIKGVISSVNLPRYLVEAGSGKVYVSSWDNKVAVVDYVSFQQIGEIPAGTGPEKMLTVGEHTWVLNQGGFSIDSTITVIDNNTDQVDRTIAVYPRPTGIQMDMNGNVWVVCSGVGWNGFPAPGDTEGHLLCIHPENDQMIMDIAFPATDNHPEKLVINAQGDVLYYVMSDGIYKHEITSTSLETSPLVSKSGIYSIGFDPVEELIYASDAVDFSQNGWIYRYDPVTGEQVSSHKVGIVPGEFYFAN
jgi:hypothetical protein